MHQRAGTAKHTKSRNIGVKRAIEGTGRTFASARRRRSAAATRAPSQSSARDAPRCMKQKTERQPCKTTVKTHDPQVTGYLKVKSLIERMRAQRTKARERPHPNDNSAPAMQREHDRRQTDAAKREAKAHPLREVCAANSPRCMACTDNRKRARGSARNAVRLASKAAAATFKQRARTHLPAAGPPSWPSPVCAWRAT